MRNWKCSIKLLRDAFLTPSPARIPGQGYPIMMDRAVAALSSALSFLKTASMASGSRLALSSSPASTSSW
jgi:hypothetical protein